MNAYKRHRFGSTYIWAKFALYYSTYVHNGLFSLSHVRDDPVRDDEKNEVFWSVFYQRGISAQEANWHMTAYSKSNTESVMPGIEFMVLQALGCVYWECSNKASYRATWLMTGEKYVGPYRRTDFRLW